MIKFWLTSFIILVGTISIKAQKENRIKLDLLRAIVYQDIALAFEHKWDNSGIEAQVAYIRDIRRITDRSTVDPFDLTTYLNTPSFDFKESDLEFTFTYRKYFKFLDKPKRFYLGIVNINHFNLSVEDGYEEKFEEVFPNREPRIGKNATEINLGVAFGFLINLSNKLQIDFGWETGIELVELFKKDGRRNYTGWLPFKLSYKL